MNEMTESSDYELTIPTLIVDPKSDISYNRGKLLGKGGFARVYEITDSICNRVYADKIISRRQNSSKDKVKREIGIHKHLRHTHIVEFIHCFQDPHFVHIILEHCEMKTLLHVLKVRKVITEPEVRYYMRQIALGVRYLHRRGVLHRDLKLGNMFLTKEMIIKIGDFGLATLLRTNGLRSKAVCGTPNYIAPEVLDKYGHGREADIWALGCMAYAMLVGTPPFETKSLSATYSKISNNDYSIPDTVSDVGKKFIQKMLHPRPDLRGHLHLPGQANDLLVDTFFKIGFCPTTLPRSAASSLPKFPLEDIVENNRRWAKESLTTCVLTNIRRKMGSFLSPNRVGCVARNVSQEKLDKRGEFRCQLSESLIHTLHSIPKRVESELCSLDIVPLFVVKWIDYSNKYGFSYQMSDGSVGVLFNDSTSIGITADKELAEFTDAKRKSYVFSPKVPFPKLVSRNLLLEYFSQYMDEKLADLSTPNIHATIITKHTTVIPQILRWLRTPSTVVMELNNSSLQINYIHDHVKMILWGENFEFYFTFIGEGSGPNTYKLESVAQLGASTLIVERLSHALAILQELGETAELLEEN